jgi:hypothetical protein
MAEIYKAVVNNLQHSAQPKHMEKKIKNEQLEEDSARPPKQKQTGSIRLLEADHIVLPSTRPADLHRDLLYIG